MADPTAFIEEFAAALVDAGMPRMPARVFAVLLANDEGASTAAHLAEVLQASPAAISGAVRYLVQVRLAVKHRRPGERHDTYRLLSDVWYEAIYNREHELARWVAVARAGVASVGAETPAGRRIADTADFFAFLQDEMSGLMGKWQARQDAAGG